MTIEHARLILKKHIDESDGDLMGDVNYVAWHERRDSVALDGEFTMDELEAIVIYVRHMREQK